MTIQNMHIYIFFIGVSPFFEARKQQLNSGDNENVLGRAANYHSSTDAVARVKCVHTCAKQ